MQAGRGSEDGVKGLKEAHFSGKSSGKRGLLQWEERPQFVTAAHPGGAHAESLCTSRLLSDLEAEDEVSRALPPPFFFGWRFFLLV